MPLILPKSVLLMIPRTASTWTAKAIQNSGIKYKQFGPKHATALPPNSPAFKFAFTRDPHEWLRSRWAIGRWEDSLTDLWDVDLEKFRANVSVPMVKMYFAEFTKGCDFVGKTESIADDLVMALTRAGEDFDEDALRATPCINQSPPNNDLIGSAYWAMKKDELKTLPPGMISRLPIELLHKLPPETISNLPPDLMVATIKRLSTEALQSAGAMAGHR